MKEKNVCHWTVVFDGTRCSFYRIHVYNTLYLIQISWSFPPIIHRPLSGGPFVICIITSLFLSVDKHKSQIRPCRWQPPRCEIFLSSLTTLYRLDRWDYYVLHIVVDNTICSEFVKYILYLFIHTLNVEETSI